MESEDSALIKDKLLNPVENKSGCFIKVKDFLRFVSIGKHYSIFYFKGRNQHSSILGGLLTIFFAIIFITYSVITLSNVINKKHFNLDETARPLVSLNTNYSLMITDEIRECPRDRVCELVTVEEFVPLMSFIQYLVNFPDFTEPPDCSNLTAYIFFK